MPLPTMDEAVMKPTRVEALVEPADAAPQVYQPRRTALLPYEQRIAILAVIPREAVPSELLRRLGASGYDVWVVSTGRAAVELAEQTPPDIILLDLDGMYEITQAIKVSGFRVLHLLGRRRNEHPMAVVVMTRLDYTEVEGPIRASADEFVNKPVEPAQLLQRLQGALARVRARHQHRPQSDAACGPSSGLAAAPVW
jgi:CheY-like chemotaxis protein